MASVKPFLMFDGTANDAIEFYLDLIPDSESKMITHYEDGPLAGKVQQALISLSGQEVMVIDSPVKHEFTFSPAISLFVICDSDEQIENVFAKLSEGGTTLMPLQEYPFAKKFCWVNDKFGVSWQLSIPPE